MTTQNELIELYLNDETKLLQDWYQQQQLQQHPDLEPIGIFPTVEELQGMAQQWLQTLYRKHHAVFQKELCRKLVSGESACAWWRRVRGQPSLYQELILAIVGERVLSPLLEDWSLPATLTLIVTSHFLDRVCEGLNCDS